MLRLLLPTIFFLVSLTALAQPRVVTSIYPYFDLTRQLAGSVAEVHLLLPPGASPHTFDPTPRDIALLFEADLMIMNGGVDEWLHTLVEASGSAAMMLEILPELVLPARDDGIEQERASESGPGDHEHEGTNPHVWLDPLLMVQAVDLIAERLMEIDPQHAATFDRRRAALTLELRTLDQELDEMLRPVKGAAFVPFHDAWPHFAARYGLDLVVEIEPFPGREPGPRYVAQALELIRDSGAKAVFNEAQLNPRPAEVVAENAGVEIYTLDPLGGSAGKETYQELLRYNAGVLLEALAE